MVDYPFLAYIEIGNQNLCEIWFDLLCLAPLSAIFQLYHGEQFSGGRSRRTRREPPTMGKQLVSFITCLAMVGGSEYSSNNCKYCNENQPMNQQN